MLPWQKRSMVQSLQDFRLFSTPGSPNEWTSKTHEGSQPRREEACVICAVKDWLENRHKGYLFQRSCWNDQLEKPLVRHRRRSPM